GAARGPRRRRGHARGAGRRPRAVLRAAHRRAGGGAAPGGGRRGGRRLDAPRGARRGADARGPLRAPGLARRRRGLTVRSLSALFRKELRTYYGSPFLYIVAAAFLAMAGFYFHSDLIYFVSFGFGVNIMENFWQIVFVDLRLVLIFAIPLLTMRLLAEERRLGTLELLLTYPLRDGAVVAAKLGACLVVVGTLLA